MNIVEVLNATRKAAEDFVEDPFMKIKAIDIEIAFYKMNIAVCCQKIKELQDQRQQVWDSIKK